MGGETWEVSVGLPGEGLGHPGWKQTSAGGAHRTLQRLSMKAPRSQPSHCVWAAVPRGEATGRVGGPAFEKQAAARQVTGPGEAELCHGQGWETQV